MKPHQREELMEYIEEVRQHYSRKDRDRNYAGETFDEAETIEILSDMSAIVVFLKSSGYRALCWIYWVKNKWWHLFVSVNHLVGLDRLQEAYREVETKNYEHQEKKKKEGPTKPGWSEDEP